jgi:two-component system response regulator HydG
MVERNAQDMSLRLPVAVRILIVDDDPSTLDVLAQVLARDGYECLVAEDGRSAMEMFRANEVAAALVDFELPDLTGVQLVREIKRLRPSVPVIVMTGNPSQRLMFEASEAGAYTFLTKPIDLTGLRRLVQKASASRARYEMTYSRVEVKRSSVLVKWSRWIVGKD